ncbi:MAG: undecaprenyl/decaprenyl-phosphate alpha-N-acetylglucosaminyl 1-phosphate transferase [Lentisphaerales bacterium]|nr:MAG: undecaprenyl/decaprenyl-phosphate alpha-N-acetylglucosaminyl 1-phosphate transferase [Lentisphaerales bacterium]
MSILLYVALSFIGSCFLALLLTPLVARLAVRCGCIDVPVPPVKTHSLPTPYFGGIALAAAILLVAVPVCILSGCGMKGWILAGAGCALCMLGLADDIRPHPVAGRLGVQVCFAAVLIMAGFRIEVLPFWLSVPVTLLWIVGVTNAMNMLDILDGLAAGIAAVAAIAFVGLGLLGDQPFVVCVGASVAGAAVGFLRYNRAPARIFMGDAGSYLLGLILAVLALEAKYTAYNNVGTLAPLLILAVPLFEICLVVLFRLMRGIPVFRASKDHLALRLRAAGLSHKDTVLSLCAVGAVAGVAAITMTLVGTVPASIILCVILALAVVAAYVVGSVPTK